MKLASMRFKDYVWPHNPKVYEIRYQRDVVSHRVPFGTYILQNMGRRNRVLRGEGEFAGADAYTEFKKLATVFYDGTPGVLVHPLWDAAMAYFTALHLKQEPTENYVAYDFEFWECYDGYSTGLTVLSGGEAVAGESGEAADTLYYTAVSGDCLWSIAAAYDLSLTGLLALNPQIRNPNLLAVGDTVRVR
ncbi:MAG: LysM peptidoglycan-binding domain-containing protein [Oscillospiraceae bacterium]|nr:LysM peptidoglycan-binding domain-containing protein [Oscillospiraceae bacterium]